MEPDAAGSDGPFASLERARDEIRSIKKSGAAVKDAKVVVRGGSYHLAGPLELTAEDSGTVDGRIAYIAASGEEVRLIGGRTITSFKAVADPDVLERLDESARGSVLEADLKSQGVSDFGSASSGGIELFFNDEAMQIARWPNRGFTRIAGLLNIDPHKIHGIPGDKTGKFVYSGDRPARWASEKDLWLHGYWFWDWSDERQKVEAIDLEKKVISLKPPYHGYGYRMGQWYYAFNALSELDLPGEWYLDREKGVLYFWPPSPIEKGKVIVSALPSALNLKDTSYVTIRGFIIEATRGTPVTISGGSENEIVGCVIRNTGSGAVSISGGRHNGVIGCDIYQTARSGISLSGGDRKTLTPAGHYAENNNIHHYGRVNRMYCPAVSLDGVGNRVSHNLMHNAPHQAISFGGNDHVIEFNEIHSVCYESNDAGAIYSGRDWSMRGTVIRNNFMHHINGFEGRGCVGVYLDDMFCGTEISGNVFYKVTSAAFIGGGRDCVVKNNIFVNCVPAMHIDDRAMNWANYHVGTTMTDRLKEMPYLQPPWSERYPELLKILDDEPAAPKGNVVINNVCYGGKWDDICPIAKKTGRFENNILDVDPEFVQPEEMDFQLRPDSPVYGMGIEPIPFGKIGLYQDDRRASWPVIHKVRETIARPANLKEATKSPELRVAKRTAIITIDGNVTPDEWSGAHKTKAMFIGQGISGEPAKPWSYAWLACDEDALYVAVSNDVNPDKPILKEDKWGENDAVEIALKNPATGEAAPIIVLRGYAGGRLESSVEAGAEAEVARKAGESVTYAVRLVDAGRWDAEWRIPFAGLGVDPAKHRKIAFNATVRKTADSLWLMWKGTGGYSWKVDDAGFIILP